LGNNVSAGLINLRSNWEGHLSKMLTCLILVKTLRFQSRADEQSFFRHIMKAGFQVRGKWSSPKMADNEHDNNDDDLGGGGTTTGVITRTKPKTKKPSLYKVLLLNDDYTPMEFVVHVLQRFFGKDMEAATTIMLHVHQHGVGVCGVFTYEVAETKVAQVVDFARQNQHPLQCTMERE